MNRQKSIALFAAIAAIAMTAIGLTGVSATPLMVSSAAPQSAVGGMTMLGHVEYTLMDSDGLVKQYLQGDNEVVDAGKDCVGRYVFGTALGAGTCDYISGTFQYIAIGNLTDASITGVEEELESAGATDCGDSGGGQEGELARRLVTPTITVGADNSGATIGTAVELNLASPFTFTGGINATNTVHQSAIFNGDVASKDANGACVDAGTPGTDWEMFAVQNLNTGSGIAVTDGDSLSVKWTITIGA